MLHAQVASIEGAYRLHAKLMAASPCSTLRPHPACLT